jgi:hypothetical protein
MTAGEACGLRRCDQGKHDGSQILTTSRKPSVKRHTPVPARRKHCQAALRPRPSDSNPLAAHWLRIATSSRFLNSCTSLRLFPNCMKENVQSEGKAIVESKSLHIEPNRRSNPSAPLLSQNPGNSSPCGFGTAR